MIIRRFVETPAGMLHCAIAGTGRPVLLLHQTPRSWDEYRDVLPLLGREVQAIAVDTIGFGDSCKPPLGHDSIEYWAAVSVGLLDALGIERFAVVGHHTGAVIATEIAAAFPQRVDAAVLSASSLVDAGFRARHAKPSRIDNVQRKADGSHLTELWRIRQPWYPQGDTDLLERFVVGSVRYESELHNHAVVHTDASVLPVDETKTLETRSTICTAAGAEQALEHSPRIALDRQRRRWRAPRDSVGVGAA